MSDTEKEQPIESLLFTRNMSRCSLRLDDSRLDRSTASFSVGGATWGSSRQVIGYSCIAPLFVFPSPHFFLSSFRLSKSRRSQRLSLSCSESLLNTPRKLSAQPFLNSSIHSEASDATLLSSLLDDSSVKEHTLVDSLWGKTFWELLCWFRICGRLEVISSKEMSEPCSSSDV